MLVAIVEDTLAILVARVADKATAKSLTEVTRLDTEASSASVAKPVPSPIITLILVIAAALTLVRADTFPTTVLIDVIALAFVVIFVLLFPMLVASVADKATAKSLTDVILVLAVPILVASVAESATA